MSWYRAQFPREAIIKIRIAEDETLAGKGEQWFSEELGCRCIVSDFELQFCTEKLPAQPDLFEGFAFLQEIVGLEKLLPGEDMSGLFRNCGCLQELDLESWDLSRTRKLAEMFEGCSSLRKVCLSSWNVSAVEDFHGLFKGCRNLHEISVGDWDVSSAKDCSELFYGCQKLKVIPVEHWNLSNAESLEAMFAGCSGLESLPLGKWHFPKVRSLQNLFLECKNLKELDVGAWDISNCEDLSGLFSCCSSLEKLDVSKWRPRKARDLSCLFNRCDSLAKLDLHNWRPNNGQNFDKMFQFCGKLSKLNLKHFPLGTDASCEKMFFGFWGELLLPETALDFNTLKAGDSWFRENMGPMELRHISRIYLKKRGDFQERRQKLWCGDVRNSGAILVAMPGESLNLYTAQDHIYANPDSRGSFTIRSSGGESWLYEINGLELLDTSRAEDMGEMFAGNRNVQSLAVSHFQTQNVRCFDGMFRGCNNLSRPDISHWEIREDASIEEMFL